LLELCLLLLLLVMLLLLPLSVSLVTEMRTVYRSTRRTLIQVP
jgi:hypothetical protein